LTTEPLEETILAQRATSLKGARCAPNREQGPLHMATNNPGSFIGPVDATRVPRYAEPTTFARLPRLDEVSRADVTILGIPFDSGVSSRPAAA